METSYKEKYEQALERAKMEMSKDGMKNDVIAIHLAETIFPELKESEDERIRKRLIQLFQSDNEESFGEFTNKQFVSWLEKQGQKDILEDAILDDNEDGLIAETIRYKHEKQSKQKLDKVEPKFKVGDWIINPRTGLIKHIKNVLLCDNNGNYEFESSSMSIDSVDNSFHLWTIQDAKDGDVLWHSDTASHGTFIFKQIRYDGKVLCYCDYDSEDHFCTGEHHTCCWSSDKCIKPATKEQRELLFQKMHEAGYEWDFKKKDLKKINSYCQENCKGFQETGKCFADGECKAKRETEQRPTQEIEPFEAEHGKYYYCIKDYFCGGRKQASKGDVIQALRGLPIMGLKDASEYFLPVNFIKCNSAWSEEDSYYRNHIIQIIEEINNAPLKRGEDWEAYINWLKSLRPQKCLIPSEEEIEKAAQEWDSKANFNPFYMTMENGKPTGVKQSITTHKESFKAGICWILKSLKGRVQPQWKPSDEQMMALLYHCSNGSVLSSLYNDLKKLKDS